MGPPQHRPFVFLDRDGTIIVDRHYLADPADVVLCAGAVDGLRVLQHAGRRLVVVTNQSGIGRGYFTEAQMHTVNDRMRALLHEHRIVLDGIYWCPHAPVEDCECRKPRTALVERAIRDLDGDLHDAAVIGDSLADLQLARNLGVIGVYVRTGREPVDPATLIPAPDLCAENLAEAAPALLARGG